MPVEPRGRCFGQIWKVGKLGREGKVGKEGKVARIAVAYS